MYKQQFLLLRARVDSFNEYLDLAARNFAFPGEMYHCILDLQTHIADLQEMIADELGAE